jgi:hypothetical protein
LRPDSDRSTIGTVAAGEVPVICLDPLVAMVQRFLRVVVRASRGVPVDPR